MLKKFLGKRIFSSGIATVLAISGISLTTNMNVYGASQLKTIGNVTATLNKGQTVIIDGTTYQIDAYNINGYNYFKTRDITKPLNFETSWDRNLSAVWIETDQPYEDEDEDGVNPKLKNTVNAELKSDYIFCDAGPVVANFVNIDGYTYLRLSDLAVATADTDEHEKPTEKYITADYDKLKKAIVIKTHQNDGVKPSVAVHPVSTSKPIATDTPKPIPIYTLQPSQIEEGTFPAKILRDGVTPEMWYAKSDTYDGVVSMYTQHYINSGGSAECASYAMGRFSEVYNRKTPLTEFYGSTKDWIKNIKVLIENGNKDNLKVIEDVNDIREKSMAVFKPIQGSTITQGHVVFVERIDRDSNGKPLYVYFTEANGYFDLNKSTYDPGYDGRVQKETFEEFQHHGLDLQLVGYIISN